MLPLTACPSPQGEKPDGIQEPTAVPPAETGLSNQSSGACLEMRGSSDAQSGVTEPTSTTVGVSSLESAAEAEGTKDDTEALSDGMEHFRRLRRRLLLSTLLASLTAVPVCWLLFDLPAALSLLVGSVAGLLYLVLLARSVARLGGDRRSVGKIQLLVPVVLVLASSRIHALELVPALVGFLLYKPALLVQAYLDR